MAGIAAGVSERIGVDITVVRIVLVLAGLLNGFGVAAYVIAWLAIPLDGEEKSIGARVAADKRGIAIAVAIAPAFLALFLVASELGAPWFGSLTLPLYFATAGLIVVWRNVSADERSFLHGALQPLAHVGLEPRRSWTAFGGRVAAALALGISGVVLLADSRRRAAVGPLAGALLLVAGLVVAFGPWWLGLARDLVAERQARVRAEERAEMAARIHDSVLQTLALIQRRADQPQQVIQLARAQESELRAWLFEGRMPGPDEPDDESFASALRRMRGDVEQSHGVLVEAVVVGDCPLSEEVRALLAAGREAAVNAAKWSGADVVSLFGEVDREAVSLFVRDRGHGFNPDEVAPDRRGLEHSVRGRMERHGGSARVRSAPGEGTEIELRMPRQGAASSQPVHP